MLNYFFWWPFCFGWAFFVHRKWLWAVKIYLHAKFCVSSSKIDRVMGTYAKNVPSLSPSSDIVNYRAVRSMSTKNCKLWMVLQIGNTHRSMQVFGHMTLANNATAPLLTPDIDL